MANRGPSYGLSKELELKNAARFNLAEAQDTLLWLSECLGERTVVVRDDQEYCDVLRDGVLLCRLMERLLAPTPFPYHRQARMPFLMMENTSKFLDGARAMGVPDITCFQTVDLYDGKAAYKVVECLRCLAAAAQKRGARVPIPQWVVKMSEKRPRRFDQETINKGKTLISYQYGSNKGASQKGMKPYGLNRQIMP